MIRNPFDIAVFNISYAALAGIAGNITRPVPGILNARCELILASFTLTTDATVANRVPRLEIDNSIDTAPLVTSNLSVTASSTYHFTFAQGLNSSTNTDVNRHMQGFPFGIFILEDWYYNLIIENGVAGDASSNLRFYFKVWTFEQ